MALTSSSTISDALDQYNDNLLWEGDSTKARNCLEAIRFLMANRPSRMAEGENNLDYESLKDQSLQIENYLNSSTSTVNKTSFTQGRMLL